MVNDYAVPGGNVLAAVLAWCDSLGPESRQGIVNQLQRNGVPSGLLAAAPCDHTPPRRALRAKPSEYQRGVAKAIVASIPVEQSTAPVAPESPAVEATSAATEPAPATPPKAKSTAPAVARVASVGTSHVPQPSQPRDPAIVCHTIGPDGKPQLPPDGFGRMGFLQRAAYEDAMLEWQKRNSGNR